MSVIRSVVLGCGAYLPDNVVSNDELAKCIDTSDAWIVERTGIRRRHIAREGEVTSDLALKASEAALSAAGIGVDELDLIVCATTTPDETFPATATRVQARLGMTRGAAFDVQAVCSGFIYGLSVADNFIRAGQARTVLLIGAETMSRLMDWSDRTTCVLFGDGAGAIVLRGEAGTGGLADRGVHNTKLYSDGRLHDLLYVDGGPSSTRTTGYLRMQGKEVFRHAVTNISAAIQASADAAGLAVSDIDWFVPHQANQRILDGTARRLGIPAEKVITTVAEHGNTSAASVPLALAAAVGDGRIKAGDLVLLEAMGGGFTWGSALLRW
ncbi:MAG: ketoacyl-ACP synthase III [Alphaproteobacteria bacterium]|nr:ketoacyl-ACP synthase III [Alphaproteobacteria bacterium]